MPVLKSAVVQVGVRQVPRPLPNDSHQAASLSVGTPGGRIASLSHEAETHSLRFVGAILVGLHGQWANNELDEHALTTAAGLASSLTLNS